MDIREIINCRKFRDIDTDEAYVTYDFIGFPAINVTSTFTDAEAIEQAIK